MVEILPSNAGSVGSIPVREKKALSSRGRGRLRGFLELRRPWGFSPEAQRASRVVLGTSGLRACGEGECVIALES